MDAICLQSTVAHCSAPLVSLGAEKVHCELQHCRGVKERNRRDPHVRTISK